MKQSYADVIVDITGSSLDHSFQYRIPEALCGKVQEGSKVIVPFGRGKRLVAGYVLAVGDTPKLEEDRIKDIADCPENAVSAEDRMVRLAAWIRRTYGSSFIHALKTVIPVKEKKKARKMRGSEEKTVYRPAGSLPALDARQQEVYAGICGEFSKEKPRPCLLRGVTGSGKTSVYMKLIHDTLTQRKQAILLIPEISLTWQTVSRFTACFGEQVAVLHSRLSAGEKSELIERVRKKEVSLVIGPRSALFTPFEDLGLIIVDEEHDSSYQSEKTPHTASLVGLNWQLTQ